MQCELITWADAGGDEEDQTWMATADVKDDNPIVQTVGWVIKETKANVTVAMDYCGGETHTRSRIPVGMIISRVVLFDTQKEGE